ncbi:hypothetical protein V1520DRAFT_353634 [Lipomyces starkeyi]|uniref:Uncharacterized protein n=1 Tax=Lipomyces starkeyi NRRL Y-11557 TaxID=675824 RepID=A0A1E3Q1L2_LIPST|nr:hypothetical protein LIPSTDRAFT_4778 [Lipomyces starkeyi NRRL Y-11557]
MSSLKRRREADFSNTAPMHVLDFVSLAATVDAESPVNTPELDFSSVKRWKEDYSLDDSFDSASSPDDASDLYDLFAPSLSVVEDSSEVSLAIDRIMASSESSASAIVIYEDEDATTDDEELPIINQLSATAVGAPKAAPTSSPMGPPPLPLGIQAMGPAIGHWTDKTPERPVKFGQLSASPVLPKQQRLPRMPTHTSISHTVGSSVSSSVDALLEQYLDVNNVVDNSVAFPSTKSWIDRYMTIPICGYLNRAIVEPERDVAVAATTVAGISKPPESMTKRKPSSSLKRAASAPAVYGLKRRSVFAGKGKEMVGLGVMVGDLLL